MRAVLLMLIGLVAGVLGGLVGVGGGIIIIPALVYMFGFSQHQAQGTTLAILVPPIGLLAAWMYYKAGYVDLKVASYVCIGFFFGGAIGGKLASGLPTSALEKVFGVFLVLFGIRMILK